MFPLFTELYFKDSLVHFLLLHRNYIADLQFNVTVSDVSELVALSGRFDVTAGRMHFKHSELTEFDEQNEAMDEIRNGLDAITFEGEAFQHPIAYSYGYMQWESNNAIATGTRQTGRQTSCNICFINTVVLLFLNKIFFHRNSFDLLNPLLD